MGGLHRPNCRLTGSFLRKDSLSCGAVRCLVCLSALYEVLEARIRSFVVVVAGPGGGHVHTVLLDGLVLAKHILVRRSRDTATTAVRYSRQINADALVDSELGAEMFSGEEKVTDLWSVQTAEEAVGKFG